MSLLMLIEMNAGPDLETGAQSRGATGEISCKHPDPLAFISALCYRLFAMEKALTFKSAVDEAAYYTAIDKLFRAIERSVEGQQKVRADSERLKAETRAISARIGAK